MKLGRWLLVLASLVALVMTANADDPKTSGKSDKKSGDMSAKLEQMERGMWEAFKSRDVPAFQALVDKDAYGADPTGFWPASQVGEMMKDFELRDYELENFKTTQLGADVYLLTYSAKQDASFKGQPLPKTPSFVSTVFAKRGNKWLAVYHQETPGMIDEHAGHSHGPGHQH